MANNLGLIVTIFSIHLVFADTISVGSGNSICRSILLNTTGIVDIPIRDAADSDWCARAIQAENLTSLYLFFTPGVADDRVTVYCFQNIVENGTTAYSLLDTWEADQANRLRTFTGRNLRLNVMPVVRSSLPQPLAAGPATLAYTAQRHGEEIPSCNVSSLPTFGNGRIQVTGATFGSVASFQCAEGYILVDGPGHVTCTVRNHSLSWVADGSRCESACEHPSRVLHATERVIVDTFVNFRPDNNETNVSRETNTSPLLQTNTTVIYSCLPPYVRNGPELLHCLHDGHSVPQWSALPPSCVIPDCSSSPMVFRQHNGAIVNPSYPSSMLGGGGITCTWQLLAPRDAKIILYTHYVDLPPSPAVELLIYDTGGARPHQLLRLSGQPEPQNVTSHTSQVAVTYRGPASDVTGHAGFYLNYTMISPESKLRQAAGPSGGANQPIQGFSTASTATAAKRSSPLIPGNRQVSPVQPTTQGRSDSGDDDSSDNWKIAVGVVIPLAILISVLVGVYICYRKKYPVRMIIGREFGKFSNPQYARPRQTPALVRDDADDYFSNRNSANISSEEYNPVNNMIHYDNKAFVSDDIDDEEERERIFLERKSWLFRKAADENEKETPGKAEEAKQGSSAAEPDQPAAETPKERTKSVDSGDTDISEILAEQRQTPVPKRRQKKTRASSDESSSTSSQQHVGESEKPSETNSQSEDNSDRRKPPKSASTVSLSSRDELPHDTTPTQPEEDSECVKTAMKLFQQPSFEEVWADVKARSRSLSVDQPLKVHRPRSFSVDPSKSARKMSMHDELLLSAHARSLVEGKKLTAAHRSQELPDLTAAVVGVDIRDRPASFTSSVISSSSSSDEEHFDDIPQEEKERCLSLTSVNSNPHLVTDLDDEDEDLEKSKDGVLVLDSVGNNDNNETDDWSPDPEPRASTSNTRADASVPNSEHKDTHEDKEEPGTKSDEDWKQKSDRIQSWLSSGSDRLESNDSDQSLEHCEDVSSTVSLPKGCIDTDQQDAVKHENSDTKDQSLPYSAEDMAHSQKEGITLQDEGQDRIPTVKSTSNTVLQPGIGKGDSLAATEVDTGASDVKDSPKVRSTFTKIDPGDSSSDDEPTQIATKTQVSPDSKSQFDLCSGNEHKETPIQLHNGSSDDGSIQILRDGQASGQKIEKIEGKKLDEEDSEGRPSGHADDQSEEIPNDDRKLGFELPPREHSASDYSNMSEMGSLPTSSEESSNEAKSYDFGTGIHDSESDKDSSSHEEGAVVAASMAMPVASPATESGHNEPEEIPATSDADKNDVAKKKIISRIKFSDSSSDSSDRLETAPAVRRTQPAPEESTVFNLSHHEHPDQSASETEPAESDFGSNRKKVFEVGTAMESLGSKQRHPLVAGATLSHSDDSDEDDESIKMTDSDISDALNSDEEGRAKNHDDSSDSEGGLKMADRTYEPVNKSVYTIREQDSDEDIDV